MLHLLYDNLPKSQADLILCMLASVPLSYLLSLIRNKYIFLALSISVTYAIQSFLFPEEKGFLWIQQVIVYVLLLVSPRKRVGVIVFVESFIFLSGVQLRRMYISYGSNELDITAILMMQTFLYVGLGFNYQNGALPDEKLSPDERARAVKQLPDILTYLGYVFYIPACIVGPVYEFADYSNYLHRRNQFERIPNTIVPAAKEFGIFLLSAGTYLATSKFDMDYLVSQDYLSLPLIGRLLMIIPPVWHTQFKYMLAWSLAVCSVKASGLGYQQIKNQKGQLVSENFERIRMNAILDFLFHPSFKVKADSWNISVQQALKKYIYDPVFKSADAPDQKKKKAQQNKGQLATLITSSLWHGLYPAYYLTFGNWLFVLQSAQEIFRIRRQSPRFQKIYNTMKIGVIIEWFYATYYMSYFGLIFLLTTSDRFMVTLRSTYFIPAIFIYVFWFVVVRLGIFTRGSRKKKQ